MVNGNQFPPKDPEAVLDYKFDWAPLDNNTGLSNWLSDGEKIVSYLVTVPEGLTKVSDNLADNDTSVVVWLSGGTSGVDYPVECRITTATRTDERSVILPVRER